MDPDRDQVVSLPVPAMNSGHVKRCARQACFPIHAESTLSSIFASAGLRGAGGSVFDRSADTSTASIRR